MPLQGKVPFKRKTPKGVVHLDQELFYCKATNEVFPAYEDLFERAIQCSSLVWTCALTGRGGLTFQEALDSEEKARKSLQAIPWHLKQLLLMQVERCKATRLQELSDKVYSLVHNRFAIGETVEVTVHGAKRPCEVTDVRLPGSSNKNKSPSKKNDDSTPKKATPSKMRYEVCEKESEIEVLHVVSPDNLSRPKGSLSKDKTKLLLKHSVQTKDGILRVKNTLTKKYNLDSALNIHSPIKKVKSEKSSKSNTPVKSPKVSKNNTPSKASPVKSALKNSQSPSKIKKTLKSIDADIRKMFPSNSAKVSQQSKENKPISMEDIKSIKELKMEEDKRKKLDLKEKKKSERKLLNEYLIEWRKRREDLECDDLKDLPSPAPVTCGIPRDHFGEGVAIMEFLHQFSSVLLLKNTFPNGVKLGLMEKALTDTDIQGPFNDLLQMLLLAVFKQQETEDEEPDKTKDSNKEREDTCEESDMETAAAVKAANKAMSWPVDYLGCKIRCFPLDPFTLTELLRLHLLSSGAEITTIASDRGNFKNVEDPGLVFKIKNPDLMKKLATTSVFLFSPEERLQVLKVLMEQLLTYPTFRDILSQNIISLNDARKELLSIYKKRRSHVKGIEPTNTSEKENEKEHESILMNSENTDIPGLLETKVARVMTEEEKAELLQFEKKVKELRNTIHKIQSFFRVEPIGTDRAHRCYWLFNTVDGLFVEDSNPYAELCLQKPTPTQVTINSIVSQDELPLSLMNKFLRLIHNSHDKENNLSKANRQDKNKSHKMLSNLNGLTPTKMINKDEKNPDKKSVFGMCTANPVTCLVHGSNPNRITWGFYKDEKDLDALINGLNSRGNREFQLKKNLLQEKARVIESLQKCEASRLNILDVTSEEDVVEQRKSQRLQGDKTQFVGIHPEEALESTLRDAILDNEDKIWSGGLGAIKVQNRDAWRTAIENNSYDPQTDDIPDVDIPMVCPLKLKCGDVASTSRSPSPPPCLSPNVKDLAKAIIQLASCIQTRYLSEPLGGGGEHKRHIERAEAERKKQKDDLDDAESGKSWHPVRQPKSPMERWKESIMGCTSLSQLFLHLITLENSITWHRSALKASCKICRKKGDGENMLLCDKCDRGFHLYCLKPPLKEVPSGEWFCLSCTPKPEVEELRERKSRRTLNYKEENSCEESGDEEDSDENDSTDETDDEPRNRKAKVSKSGSNEIDHNFNKCSVCRKGGSLICCDGCPESTHLTCAKPPLRRVPRGKWFCQKCVKKGKKASLSQSVDSTSNTRGSAKRRMDTNKQTVGSSSSSRRFSADTLEVTACVEILDSLSKHQDSWPFADKRKKVDYKRIVKRPVDLTSIRSKLDGKSYCTNNQFVADIYLMFQNCEVFNSTKSDEQEASKRLNRYFQTLLRRYKFEDTNDVCDSVGKRPRRSY